MTLNWEALGLPEPMAYDLEASYPCPACGEEIHIPVDPSQGAEQEYVEDCPVCCRAVVLRVTIHSDGTCSVRGELEY